MVSVQNYYPLMKSYHETASYDSPWLYLAQVYPVWPVTYRHDETHVAERSKGNGIWVILYDNCSNPNPSIDQWLDESQNQ